MDKDSFSSVQFKDFYFCRHVTKKKLNMKHCPETDILDVLKVQRSLKGSEE